MSAFYFKQFRKQATVKSLQVVRWALGVMPRWLVQFFVGVLFTITNLFIKKLHQISIRNLQLVYGESKNKNEYKNMSKRCLKNISRSMTDLLYYVNRPEKLSKIVRIGNEDNLKDALQKGRGIIVVTAHLGNLPLMFISLVQKGYKVNVIIRPMRDNNFSAFMYQLCALRKVNMIQLSPKKKFIKESLTALRKNELLFILFDEVVPKEEGVVVEFFNRKVTRAAGPILFHQRTGSPILPIFIVKDERNNFEIYIEQALMIEKGFSDQKNKEINIAKLTNSIEQFVKEYPMQWGGWFNKRC